MKTTTREIQQSVKINVLTHYGNGILACVNCGENRLQCLTLDHPNNDGNKARKDNPLSGYKLYQYLEAQDYPEGYQTLCFNCNIGKAIDLRLQQPASEVISIRVPGGLYLWLLKRAELRKMTLAEYCKARLVKDTEYKDENSQKS